MEVSHEGDYVEDNAIVEDNVEEVVVTEYDYQYESPLNAQDRLFFDYFYQPEETANGSFACRICKRAGKDVEFADRAMFVAHRYRNHGTFNNTMLCPMNDCRESFASICPLRVHLKTAHDEPLEVHHKVFANAGEFEKWRHLVEASSNSRFIMVAKQPKNVRQMIHCDRSEHRMVMQTKSQRVPRVRMAKPGACCPAQISFQIEPNGEVNCYYQLHHVGHADDVADTLPNDVYKPLASYFPTKPMFYGETAMQYVQIDVHEMSPTVYGATIYDHILFVSDSKTEFMWAKALIHQDKTIIFRLLVDIFTQFGVPEGFSCTHSPALVREAMRLVKSVFQLDIREIWCDPTYYYDLEEWALVTATSDLGSSTRWVETLQFLIMEMNQKRKKGEKTPFEKMFKRKPPNLYEEDDEEGREVFVDESIHYPPIIYSPGERVYLRQQVRKVGRNESQPFVYGLIAEVDKSTPLYPYKVHYSKTDDPWPCESNVHVWASTFDVLPTTHSVREFSLDDTQSESQKAKEDVDEMLKSRKIERREILSKMYCSCSGQKSQPIENGDISKCYLFRNSLCSNQMARVCCMNEGCNNCPYHSHYPLEDSYKKIEQSISLFNKRRTRLSDSFEAPQTSRSYEKSEPVSEERKLPHKMNKVKDSPMKRKAYEMKKCELNPTPRKSSRKITKKNFDNFVP